MPRQVSQIAFEETRHSWHCSMLLPSRGDEAAAASVIRVEDGLLGEAVLASETVAMSAGS
jgi:hypothetical protein